MLPVTPFHELFHLKVIFCALCLGRVGLDLIHVQFLNFSYCQILVARNFILLCYAVLAAVKMGLGKLELEMKEVG